MNKLAAFLIFAFCCTVGFGIYNFPKGENPIFSPGTIDIGEIARRLVNQEKSSYSYRYYIILNEQPRFQMEKSTWSDFTGDESFGYIPKRYPAWEHLLWPGEVTPGKEEKHHREIPQTDSGYKK